MKKIQVSVDGGSTWHAIKPMDMSRASFSSEPVEVVYYSDAPRAEGADGRAPFVPGMFELAKRWQAHYYWRTTCIGGEGPDYTLNAEVDGVWTVILRGSLAELDRQLTEMERKP